MDIDKHDLVIDAEVVDVHDLPVLYGGKYYRNREPQEPSALQEAELAANPERRCVARKNNGENCRRWAIQGGTVCKMHGANKRVLEKARRRVENNADKLMRVLLEFAYDETKSESSRLIAIRDALDRAGLKPSQTVEIGPTKPYEEVFDGISGGPRDLYRSERGYDPRVDPDESPPALAEVDQDVLDPEPLDADPPKTGLSSTENQDQVPPRVQVPNSPHHRRGSLTHRQPI